MAVLARYCLGTSTVRCIPAPLKIYNPRPPTSTHSANYQPHPPTPLMPDGCSTDLVIAPDGGLTGTDKDKDPTKLVDGDALRAIGPRWSDAHLDAGCPGSQPPPAGPP